MCGFNKKNSIKIFILNQKNQNEKNFLLTGDK